MKKFLNRIGLTVFTLFLLSPTFAQAVEVSFEEDPSLPIVYLNVAIRAGAVADPSGQSGLTNFMGEMLLRGTRNRTKEQIDLALDQIGARLEIETRSEALILRGAVLSSQLDPFLDLVKEIITQPSFPESEIRKLKAETVSHILEELGSDSTLATRRFTKILFRNHPYGKPVIGTIKDINALTRDQIAQQYSRLANNSLMLAVGTGDTSRGKISTWVNDLFPNQKASGNKEFKVTAPENPPAKRLVLIDKPDRTQTQINAGQIGVLLTNPDFFPLYLGNYAFGGPSFSARLMVEIRVKRGWSYGANSNFRHGLQPRSWQVHLFPAAKDTVAATAYTLKLVDQLKESGITDQEYQFSKQSLVNKSGFMYDTPKKRVENKLLEGTLNLPDGFMKSYGEKIGKVELAQVNAALRKFLKPDQLTVTVLGTAKDLKEPLAKAVGVPLDKVEVIPYTQE